MYLHLVLRFCELRLLSIRFSAFTECLLQSSILITYYVTSKAELFNETHLHTLGIASKDFLRNRR
jgi:hypothetical protein